MLGGGDAILNKGEQNSIRLKKIKKFEFRVKRIELFESTRIFFEFRVRIELSFRIRITRIIRIIRTSNYNILHFYPKLPNLFTFPSKLTPSHFPAKTFTLLPSQPPNLPKIHFPPKFYSPIYFFSKFYSQKPSKPFIFPQNFYSLPLFL